MNDLFTPEAHLSNTPLAALLRPQFLHDFVGQEHILGPETPLLKMIAKDELTSLILYGPPGCGKTTLAHVIAGNTRSQFVTFNAVSANTQDIRNAVKEAQYIRNYESKGTILFVDEVHRFNKAQQDVLMPYVEEGLFIFIGATTENPYFAVNAPLISRSHVFAFRPLSVENLCQVLRQAMHHPKNILPLIEVEEDVLEFMALQCEGDARRAINILEFVLKSITVNTEGAYAITRENVEACVQDKAVIYDATGEDHYDTVSAFIKSMRGSDPDAALYWLAKMLYAGEDLNFIARRLVICASEDVGNADPQALVVANSTWDVVRKVGMPEARIPLAQAVVYVATAPKSNASYKAIDAALQYVKHHPILPVPKHLKDGHYKGAKALGHGVGYQYPHAHEDHYLQQEYAPIEESFYTPTEQGFERTIKERMKQWTKKNSE